MGTNPQALWFKVWDQNIQFLQLLLTAIADVLF